MAAAGSSAAISSPGFPGLDHGLGCPFAVSGQPQPAHDVNEPGGWVEIQAKFTRRVVIGKGVMVIVEAFTWKTKGALK